MSSVSGSYRPSSSSFYDEFLIARCEIDLNGLQRGLSNTIDGHTPSVRALPSMNDSHCDAVVKGHVVSAIALVKFLLFGAHAVAPPQKDPKAEQ